MGRVQRILANAPYCNLVVFRWGNSHVVRYTTWNKNITFSGNTYAAIPSMAITMTKGIQAGTTNSEVEISLPNKTPPFDKVMRPYMHAPIKAEIYEFSPGDNASSKLKYRGTVEKCRGTFKLVRRILKVTVVGPKARLATTHIGLPALSTCSNQYGDEICGDDLEAKKELAEVISTNVAGIGVRIHLQFSGTPDLSNNRFARGRLVFDGLEIGIRRVVSADVGSDPTALFELRGWPPPEWVGETVNVYQGCKRTITDCRDPLRNRETQFVALGIGMVPYNPTFSDAPNS